MEEKKRILILTADTGFGHRSAANALVAALEQYHADECQVTLLNPLDDRRAPFFLREAAADYDRLVRNVPELYRLGYDLSDNEVSSLILESLLTVSLFEIMRDMVRKIDPDVIVTTYPAYQAPLVAYYTISRTHIPLVSVVTDLANVHHIWFNPDLDLCLAPTVEVQTLAQENDIAPNKVQVTGIPVSPVFSQTLQTKRELRMQLGWDPDLPTFLAVGSRRVAQLVQMLNVFNHFGRPLQVIAVAGKDEELYARLKQINWHIPAQVYNFVGNMPQFMLASDAIVCKAGGLVVTESLAAGLPILLIDMLPGQEEGNRDYVLEKGVGVMADTPIQMLETLSHWLAEGGALLKKYATQAQKMGRPDSALHAARLILDTARNRTDKGIGSEGKRAPLIELLTRNNIPLARE